MRTGRIACPGQTRSFRRARFYWVKIGEQGLTAGLPCHSHKCNKIIGGCARDATFSHASVAVAVENASMVVHGDFVEIQQIAVLMTATLLPNAGVTLSRIVWRSVDGCPCLPSIVGRGNEGIPFARETGGLVVAWLIGGYEAASGASSTPADRLGMHSILDPMRCTNIDVANPSLAAVRADFHMNVALRRTVRRHRLVVHVAEISDVVAINSDRRIGTIDLRPAAGNKKLVPSSAPVSAQGTALRASAMPDWQPHSAIRRHVDMGVQTAALRGKASVG